jgi:hypothetical protein
MMENEHFIVTRPIGNVGQKKWDFVVEDGELILHKYALQQKASQHDQEHWEDLTFWQRGVGCTMDRINVPMPLDVLREAYRKEVLEGEPILLYTGIHYDTVADAVSENQQLANKLYNYIRRHMSDTTSRLNPHGSAPN